MWCVTDQSSLTYVGISLRQQDGIHSQTWLEEFIPVGHVYSHVPVRLACHTRPSEWPSGRSWCPLEHNRTSLFHGVDGHYCIRHCKQSCNTLIWSQWKIQALYISIILSLAMNFSTAIAKLHTVQYQFSENLFTVTAWSLTNPCATRCCCCHSLILLS